MFVKYYSYENKVAVFIRIQLTEKLYSMVAIQHAYHHSRLTDLCLVSNKNDVKNVVLDQMPRSVASNQGKPCLHCCQKDKK